MPKPACPAYVVYYRKPAFQDYYPWKEYFLDRYDAVDFYNDRRAEEGIEARMFKLQEVKRPRYD